MINSPGGFDESPLFDVDEAIDLYNGLSTFLFADFFATELKRLSDAGRTLPRSALYARLESAFERTKYDCNECISALLDLQGALVNASHQTQIFEEEGYFMEGSSDHPPRLPLSGLSVMSYANLKTMQRKVYSIGRLARASICERLEDHAADLSRSCAHPAIGYSPHLYAAAARYEHASEGVRERFTPLLETILGRD